MCWRHLTQNLQLASYLFCWTSLFSSLFLQPLLFYCITSLLNKIAIAPHTVQTKETNRQIRHTMGNFSIICYFQHLLHRGRKSMKSNKIKNFIHFNFFPDNWTHFILEAKHLSTYLDLIQLHFTGKELRLKETNVIKRGGWRVLTNRDLNLHHQLVKSWAISPLLKARFLISKMKAIE